MGPPLVLVHGAPADHTRWDTVLPRLGRHFTCYAMDRRGRGASGDTPPYSLEKEADDVAAVVDALGEPVNLLGHSYGGLASIEGALRTRNLRRLITYESVAASYDPIYPPGSIDRLEALLAQGKREEMLVATLREVAGMPDDDIATLKALPAWPGRLAAASVLPRELRVDERYRVDAARLGRINVPTMIFLGGASLPMYRAGAEQLQRAIPGSQLGVLEGQGHAAMDTAPDLFVEAVAAFLGT
jgi:pimeloyl-ACP methyl ester carboxylesterase